MHCVTLAALVALAPVPDRLVRQLGGPSFAGREAAGWGLAAWGAAALPAAEAGCRSPDPEVARRSRDALRAIREGMAEAFVAGERDHWTAGWPRFRESAGDSPESRRLFAAVAADDRRADALTAPDRGPHAVKAAYADQLARARAALPDLTRGGVRPDLARAEAGRAFPPAEVALALYLGAGASDDAADPSPLFKAGFSEGLNSPLGAPFRRLYGRWLDGPRGRAALRAGLAVGELAPEAVPAARRVLADPDAPPLLVSESLMVLAHQGGRADLALASARRSDVRQVDTGRGAGPGALAVRVRDVAAVAAARLAALGRAELGRGPTGFAVGLSAVWDLMPGPASPYSVRCAFPSNEARDGALRVMWGLVDERLAEKSGP